MNSLAVFSFCIITVGAESQITFRQAPYSLNELYDKFAGMLLGYINGIVNDARLAEEHLVSFYNSLPDHLNDINADGCNVWCHLQKLARKHLSAFTGSNEKDIREDSTDISVYHQRNKFLALMSAGQQQVFCHVYYKGKTTAQLAIALNKKEDEIRKLLKEAFLIIKKG